MKTILEKYIGQRLEVYILSDTDHCLYGRLVALTDDAIEMEDSGTVTDTWIVPLSQIAHIHHEQWPEDQTPPTD